MEFLGAIVNVVFVFAVFLLAHDWLVGLRSDVSTTRVDLKTTTKELLEARVDLKATTTELLEARAEMNQFNAEATQQSAEHLEAAADLLRELRELRAEFKLMARHNLTVGEMVKLLVEARQQDLAQARAGKSTPG